MTYRWCSECGWLETADYTVHEKTGETICSKHGVVMGHIDGGVNTERQLRDHLQGYVSEGEMKDKMVQDAINQGLVTEAPFA